MMTVEMDGHDKEYIPALFRGALSLAFLACDNKGNGLTDKADDTASNADSASPTDSGETETDPCAGESTDADQDGDGLLDDWEAQYDTLDPNDADSDDDGICDGADSDDGDGLSNSAESQIGTDPERDDTDQDGMSDDWEIEQDLNPTDAADAGEDIDSDGLTNLDEFNNKTDPRDDDSDDDVYPDGYEVKNGADPNDSGDGPVFDLNLVCSTDKHSTSGATDTEGRHFVVDADGNGVDDEITKNYYGSDYILNRSADECVCTMTLEEGWARVDGMAVFTPTYVHTSSGWADSGVEEDLRPSIGAIDVPFLENTKRTDGMFLLNNIYLSETDDLNGTSASHWFAEPPVVASETSDPLVTSGVVDISGEYTVYISVVNNNDQPIYKIGTPPDSDEPIKDACARLSGKTTYSGSTAGYLQIRFDTSVYADATTAEEGESEDIEDESDSSSTRRSRETSFALVSLEGSSRQRLLSLSGSEGYDQSRIEGISLSDWSGVERVHVVAPGQPPFVLTATSPSRTLSAPVWLHQLSVSVVLEEDTSALPEISLHHGEAVTSPPRPPGTVFSLPWMSLEAFFSAANDNLSILSMLPTGSETGWSALVVRVTPSTEGSGPTWLSVDARGSGSLLSLPLATVASNTWTFRHRSDLWSASGQVAIGTDGKLSLSLTDGEVGGIDLGAASMVLEAREQ